jgi:ABC-type branched-subunit amino acid transport system substrate-binding protein/cytochrome c553
MRAKRNHKRARLVIALLLGAHAFSMAGEEAAGPAEQALAIARGRKIYLSGVPANGSPLVASVGNAAMDVPASILKCVNCHGRDGRGKAEGGVTPANIRWEELTKPSGSGPAVGRQRTAYSGKLLVRAITMGLDASGNRLAPAMPRYRLTHEQAGDLVAYLEVLGREADPGVTDTGLKIGVVLPPAGIPGAADATRRVIAAFASQVNEQGGLYGRQLKIAFVTAPDEVPARAGVIRDFVETEQPFALVSSYIAGCEAEIGRYLEENEVPLIGPIALYANDEASRRRHVFHLLAGLAGQGEALARFATQRPELSHSTALLVLREGDDEMRAVAETIGKRLVAAGWSAPRKVILAETSTPDWRALSGRGGVGAVFWCAPASGLDEFYRAAATAGSYPFLFAPSALAGRELLSAPAGFTGRIFCSFPALSSDQTPAGRRELLQLASNADFSEGSVPRTALSSAKLLVHGLRQAGKELSREKLVEILENLYGYSTEQTPAVTFTRNRRVGADGAHVVGIDMQKKSLISPSTWVPLH